MYWGNRIVMPASAPDLIVDHYCSVDKKLEDNGFIDNLLAEWEGVPHHYDGVTNKIELSINEILFKYRAPKTDDDSFFTVDRYRQEPISTRLASKKSLKENGFLMLILTMRNRAILSSKKVKGQWTAKTHPGLSSLVNHWSEQGKKPYLPDHVLKVLLSNRLTRGPEFLAAARIEQIRRIRRGCKIGSVNLTVAEQLQELAVFEIGKAEMDDGEWVYTVPNGMLKATLELQKALTLSRRGSYGATLESVGKVRKELKNADYQFKDIYEWWVHYIELRVYLSLTQNKESKERLLGLKEIEGRVSKNEGAYLKELRNSQPSGDGLMGLSKIYDHLLTYHDGLCMGLETPNVGDKGPDRKEWYLHLMYAITGSERGDKMNEIKIDTIKDNLTTLSDVDLLRKIDAVIGNGYLLVNAVVQRNTHLTAIKLLLIVVDVFARVRKVLSQKRIARGNPVIGDEIMIRWDPDLSKEVLPDLKEWKSDSRGELKREKKEGWANKNSSKENPFEEGKSVVVFCPHTLMEFAKAMKKDLGGFLKSVKNLLELRNIESGIPDFVDDCIESLEEYNFAGFGKQRKVVREITFRTALGELAHLCGSFIGFPMGPEADMKTREHRLVLNGYQRIGLGDDGCYYLKADSKKELIIESDGEMSPYVGPAGEARSAGLI